MGLLLFLLIWGGLHLLGLMIAARLCRLRDRLAWWQSVPSLLGLLVMPLAGMSALAALHAVFVHDGVCHGFTDGAWDCDLGAFVSLQIGYVIAFSVLPTLLYLVILGAMLLGALFGLWLRPGRLPVA